MSNKQPRQSLSFIYWYIVLIWFNEKPIDTFSVIASIDTVIISLFCSCVNILTSLLSLFYFTQFKDQKHKLKAKIRRVNDFFFLSICYARYLYKNSSQTRTDQNKKTSFQRLLLSAAEVVVWNLFTAVLFSFFWRVLCLRIKAAKTFPPPPVLCGSF